MAFQFAFLSQTTYLKAAAGAVADIATITKPFGIAGKTANSLSA
jgi:hypothetical protein